MSFVTQQPLILPAKSRGVHLITGDINQCLHHCSMPRAGLLHVFLQHTSAGLAINENADADVRYDTNVWLNKIAPEGADYFRHVAEGADDMPAHLKSMIFGVSLIIPVIDYQLGLGVWQGIYLGEFRNHAGKRRLILTLQGD